MIEAHRLAPVSQRERRIGNLHFLKSLRRLVELKAMQILHTLEKRRLRSRRAQRRKRFGAKLPRTCGRGPRERPNRQGSARPNHHTKMNFLHPHRKFLRVCAPSLQSIACERTTHLTVCRKIP